MVHASGLAAELAALGVSAASASVPAFEIPSFDYAGLSAEGMSTRVLEALTEGGIIAFRSIPNYANVRERYLAKAVDCALAMESDGHSEHLSTKQFNDGTRRLTLRSTAGRELDAFAETEALAVKCPGYHAAYHEFSRTLERAVSSFASALDQTSFRLSDGERVLTPRQLFGEAVRLDHFHAYEAATTPSGAEPTSERELSLLLHEDHGMFIAMSAPEFFDVNAQGVVSRRQLQSEDSGLVIRKNEDNSVVRPVLKADELVLMAGTGFTQWMEGTQEIPAVMHGMKMPSELVGTQTNGHRHLRAWFGKMTLLPPHQRMLRTGVPFEEFTNLTQRHLLASTNGVEGGDLKTVGCSGGRRLVVSEGSCAYRLCKPRPEYANTTIFPSCPSSCNYEYPSQSQVDRCNKKCECTGTTSNAGLCWMTCAAWLPKSDCPLDRQYCLGMVKVRGSRGASHAPAAVSARYAAPAHVPPRHDPAGTGLAGASSTDDDGAIDTRSAHTVSDERGSCHASSDHASPRDTSTNDSRSRHTSPHHADSDCSGPRHVHAGADPIDFASSVLRVSDNARIHPLTSPWQLSSYLANAPTPPRGCCETNAGTCLAVSVKSKQGGR